MNRQATTWYPILFSLLYIARRPIFSQKEHGPSKAPEELNGYNAPLACA
jgi:hypothetical protein